MAEGVPDDRDIPLGRIQEINGSRYLVGGQWYARNSLFFMPDTSDIARAKLETPTGRFAIHTSTLNLD